MSLTMIFEVLVDIDVGAAVTVLLVDDEIIESCSPFDIEDDQDKCDENESNIENNVTGAQARKALILIRSYLEKAEMTLKAVDEIFSAVAAIGYAINGYVMRNFRQAKIIAIFCPKLFNSKKESGS
ncbi:hypothetical protein QAD02_008062 [Eretmocerus hayati]|uniref:Uncharacterized protein n=1 Tax=Eretmocerus hayati TaxID=131215 RepID=A0ACC2N5C7_9HYME|nr:hypothetical protein QAD02_008062 [Eretmocerus hayati]